MKRIIHPETEQIKIQSEELKQDIEWIVEVIQMVFQNIMMIALYRMAEESMTDFEFDDNVFNREQQERLDLMKSKIDHIIKLTKEFYN